MSTPLALCPCWREHCQQFPAPPTIHPLPLAPCAGAGDLALATLRWRKHYQQLTSSHQCPCSFSPSPFAPHSLGPGAGTSTISSSSHQCPAPSTPYLPSPTSQDLALARGFRFTILSGDVHVAGCGRFCSNPPVHPTDAQLAKDHRFMLNVSHGPTLKHCVIGPGGCLNLLALVFMPLFLEDAVCIS